MIGKKINQLATELAPVSTDLTIIGDPVSGVSKKITLAQLGAIFSGAVSFYTNLASFPVVGDINVIYCAKDTQKLYLWSGSAYTEVFPSQALLDTYQLRSEKGVSNGYASLDSGGKVPISQLPSSIMEYKGTWNAATNTPTLANGTGDTGDVYICNVAGTVNFGAGPITFAVGDYTIYSGSIWQRSSGAVGTVTSVGASITGDSITISGSPISTSGTLAFAFAGNSTQYINGAGNLVTFPGVINEAQNLITEVYNKTGATLTKGTIVYINGGQGNLPAVTKALATGDSTSAQTYGIVRNDITNNNNGYVVVAGRISDLDTQAYTEGTQLYLSPTTAGTFTSTKAYAPNHLVYVGIVVRAHPTQGVVEVKIQNGYEMDELHNVAAQTPTNNDGLFWEASTSLWKNKSIATILGYTPQAQLNGTGFVKASGTTITYDNSTYLTTSAAATTYLPMVLSSTAKDIDINGQTFDVSSKTSPFTSGRLIVTPTFSALGYQNSGVFNGFKILTDGSAEFSNSGITRFFNQVRFDNTLTNGTYNYTLPGASGTLALTSQLTGGTVTSVGLSSATSGVTIGSTPITTSGTITLAIATASGSQQGLLSSTDWTTFNNKQNALTNPVTGTGTTNYLPKFTGTSTIGNSLLQETGTNVTLENNQNGSTWLIVKNTSAGSGAASGLLMTNNGGDLGAISLLSSTNSPANALFIRTLSTNPLVFGTGNTEQMRLNASGNLSVGNTNDTYKLDVSGTGRFTDNLSIIKASNPQVNIVATSASGVPELYLFRGTSTVVGYLGAGVNSTVSGVGDFVALENRLSSGGIVLRTNGSTALTLASTGAATFSSSVSLTSGFLSVDGLANKDTNYITMRSGFAPSDSGGIGFKAIDHSGSGTDGLACYGHDGISYYTAQTERMRITSGGNVGIGTSTFPYTSSGRGYLSINGSTDSILEFQIGASSSGFIYSSATNFEVNANGNRWLQFNTNSTEKMRITSGGNVGIGTTSPAAIISGSETTLNVKGNVAGAVGSIVARSSGSSNTTSIGIAAFDSVNLTGIYVETNSPMAFWTNSAERMRITSGGNVGIGTTGANGKLSIMSVTTNLEFDTDANGSYILSFDRTAGSYKQMTFRGSDFIFSPSDSEKMRLTNAGNLGINTTTPSYLLDVNGTARFGSAIVASLGTGLVYSSSGTLTSTNPSDQRLKNNIKSLSYGLNEILQLNPKTFYYNDDVNKERLKYGFIAQEVKDIMPELARKLNAETDYLGLETEGIYVTLVNAIKELKAELDTLKNK